MATASVDFHFFGAVVHAGDTLAAMASNTLHHLTARGLVGGPTYTVRRSFRDRGATLAAGAAWSTSGRSQAEIRRLLRGRLIS